MWEALRFVMPNLRMLALDPTHLPMVFEYASWCPVGCGLSLSRGIVSRRAFVALIASWLGLGCWVVVWKPMKKVRVPSLNIMSDADLVRSHHISSGLEWVGHFVDP
jgi:hypothetical protein